MVLRLGGFVLPYVWGNIPLIARFITWSHLDISCSFSFSCYIIQYICVLLAAVFYALHIPECYYPGRFDIIGNSHNFFHVFGAIATAYQMEAVFVDMRMKRSGEVSE